MANKRVNPKPSKKRLFTSPTPSGPLFMRSISAGRTECDLPTLQRYGASFLLAPA